MGWFWKKAAPPPEKTPVLQGVLPRDADRLGPAPPPPRTPHAPGVVTDVFASAAARAVPPGEVLGHADGMRAAAVLVLEGTLGHAAGPLGPGDLLLGPAGVLGALANHGDRPAHVLHHASPGAAGDLRRIVRGDLAGSGFPGITGIRALARTPDLCVVRFGPPPGARWVLVGVRSLALFSGRLTLVDGEEPREMRAGQLATVSDPSATLYVQAGNDSAFALGFAAPGLVVALG